MKWFETYTSNTMGGTGNQRFFSTENSNIQNSRVYYKVFSGGKYNYALLFSNIMDSTYRLGTGSHCNLICDEWEIFEAYIGICKYTTTENAGEMHK